MRDKRRAALLATTGTTRRVPVRRGRLHVAATAVAESTACGVSDPHTARTVWDGPSDRDRAIRATAGQLARESYDRRIDSVWSAVVEVELSGGMNPADTVGRDEFRAGLVKLRESSRHSR